MFDNFNIKTLQITNSCLSKISKWKDKIMVWENVSKYKHILIKKQKTKGNSIQTDIITSQPLLKCSHHFVVFRLIDLFF